MYKRPIYHVLRKRLEEPRRFAQVLAGPRQVGKTTLIQQVLADVSMTTLDNVGFDAASGNPEYWGRLVESSVGAHLVNEACVSDVDLFYWRSVNREVDFVLVKGREVIAIEVKSTARRASTPGIEASAKEFPVHKKLLVGGQGIPVEEFLKTDAVAWF